MVSCELFILTKLHLNLFFFVFLGVKSEKYNMLFFLGLRAIDHDYERYVAIDVGLIYFVLVYVTLVIRSNRQYDVRFRFEC